MIVYDHMHVFIHNIYPISWEQLRSRITFLFLVQLLLCIYIQMHPLILYLFTEGELTLRDSTSYDYHCDLIEGVTGTSDSVTYGINYRSPLNQVSDFHVASGQLPQDLMHVLFEGVLIMEIKLMLQKFIGEDKFFSLHTFNVRVSNFVYGRVEARNKPPKRFEEVHVNGTSKLPLSGMY